MHRIDRLRDYPKKGLLLSFLFPFLATSATFQEAEIASSMAHTQCTTAFVPLSHRDKYVTDQ